MKRDVTSDIPALKAKILTILQAMRQNRNPPLTVKCLARRSGAQSTFGVFKEVTNLMSHFATSSLVGGGHNL